MPAKLSVQCGHNTLQVSAAMQTWTVLAGIWDHACTKWPVTHFALLGGNAAASHAQQQQATCWHLLPQQLRICLIQVVCKNHGHSNPAMAVAGPGDDLAHKGQLYVHYCSMTSRIWEQHSDVNMLEKPLTSGLIWVPLHPAAGTLVFPL